MNHTAMTFFILIISFCVTLSVCDVYKRKLKKYFEDKIDDERCRRRQLEEFYLKLRDEYAEHYYKYH